MKIDDQISFADIDPAYAAFVDKFKPKKTTDDCYTPENIMEAVNGYVEARYGIDRARFVRPFWPGADYRTFDYPEGCVVVDNPPFSIISQIVKDYSANGIDFFLFAPYLTCVGIRGCTKIITAANITYENGAMVNTAFVTSLEPEIVARSDPGLRDTLKQIDDDNRHKAAAELPKYTYPDCVMTSTDFGYLSTHHTPFELKNSDCVFIRALDSQRAEGKAIFGGGLFLSERAAAERAAAERAAAERAAAERAAAKKWKLSDSEIALMKSIGKGGKG